MSGSIRTCRLIFAFWHGQHFMVPFLKRRRYRVKVLISRHRDGEINAIAAERLGIGTIRGSGDHGVEFQRKGGVARSRTCCRRWKKARTWRRRPMCRRSRASPAAASSCWRASCGRPILPFAMATSRFNRLNNWDSSIINLPFGRGAVVGIDADLRAAGCRRCDRGKAPPAARDGPEGRDAPRLCHGRPPGGLPWLAICR